MKARSMYVYLWLKLVGRVTSKSSKTPYRSLGVWLAILARWQVLFVGWLCWYVLNESRPWAIIIHFQEGVYEIYLPQIEISNGYNCFNYWSNLATQIYSECYCAKFEALIIIWVREITSPRGAHCWDVRTDNF